MTPGNSPMRRRNSLTARIDICGSTYFKSGKRRRNVCTCAGSKPGLTFVSRQKLFTRSEAPIKSISASVSSLTIKVLRTRAKPLPLLRAPDFNASSTVPGGASPRGKKTKEQGREEDCPRRKNQNRDINANFIDARDQAGANCLERRNRPESEQHAERTTDRSDEKRLAQQQAN